MSFRVVFFLYTQARGTGQVSGQPGLKITCNCASGEMSLNFMMKNGAGGGVYKSGDITACFVTLEGPNIMGDTLKCTIIIG